MRDSSNLMAIMPAEGFGAHERRQNQKAAHNEVINRVALCSAHPNL